MLVDQILLDILVDEQLGWLDAEKPRFAVIIADSERQLLKHLDELNAIEAMAGRRLGVLILSQSHTAHSMSGIALTTSPVAVSSK